MRCPGQFAAPAVGLACLLATVLVACNDQQREPVAFHYQLGADPVTLDPALAGDITSFGVIGRVFDGLMRLDRVRGVPVPELAESFSVSEDGLVYEFQLVPNAHFHNGRQVLASDVKYSWERVLRPETGSPNVWLLDLIQGTERFRAGEADTVSGIEAQDPNLVRVRLSEPFAPFLYHLAVPAVSVVAREEVERLGDQFGEQPVGCGPYRLVSWDRDDQLVLDAFKEHHRHRPQVQQLVYLVIPETPEALRRYQTGELDLLTEIPGDSLASLQQAYAADLRVFPQMSWRGLCFRCDQSPFDDPRVRRAVALDYDREAFVGPADGTQHTAGAGFVPQTVLGHDPETLGSHYDPDRAKALFTEAGFPGGRDQVLEVATEGEQYFGFGWIGEYPDPEPFLRPLFHSRGESNQMAYSNPEVDRLLDAARAEQDSETRLALYHQAEALIIEDAPCVAILQPIEVILLQTRWRGIPVGYSEDWLEIELAQLAEQ
jgi:ABC-type transport system substrate-binding protein